VMGLVCEATQKSVSGCMGVFFDGSASPNAAVSSRAVPVAARVTAPFSSPAWMKRWRPEERVCR